MERITPVGTVGHWILSVLLPFGFSCSTVRTQEMRATNVWKRIPF